MKLLWKNVVLFCALLAASHNTCAQAMFAGYAKFCGVPVVVTPTPHLAFATLDQAGNPVIYIDPSAMSNWTASRMFIIAHECAHHKQGHLLPEGIQPSGKALLDIKHQELEADCWAAGRLADIMAMKDLHKVIVQFISQGSTPQGNYPSGKERAAMIARCAEISTRLTSMCTTQYGICPLGTYLPVGTPCSCPLSMGPVRGLAE